MPSLPNQSYRVHPSYPATDHEGTKIDYRDDPTAWVTQPDYGPRRISPERHPLTFKVHPHDPAFLDEDSDFRSPARPLYDAVFERPIPPGSMVELTVLDSPRPVVIGLYHSVAQAHDVAYRAGFTMFALRAIIR